MVLVLLLDYTRSRMVDQVIRRRQALRRVGVMLEKQDELARLLGQQQ